jgi:hypothetical protein
MCVIQEDDGRDGAHGVWRLSIVRGGARCNDACQLGTA